MPAPNWKTKGLLNVSYPVTSKLDEIKDLIIKMIKLPFTLLKLVFIDFPGVILKIIVYKIKRKNMK